jgi:hypothetical protein
VRHGLGGKARRGRSDLAHRPWRVAALGGMAPQGEARGGGEVRPRRRSTAREQCLGASASCCKSAGGVQ